MRVLAFSLLTIVGLSSISNAGPVNTYQNFTCHISANGGKEGSDDFVKYENDLKFAAKNIDEAYSKADAWLREYIEEVSALRQLPESIVQQTKCAAVASTSNPADAYVCGSVCNDNIRRIKLKVFDAELCDSTVPQCYDAIINAMTKYPDLQVLTLRTFTDAEIDMLAWSYREKIFNEYRLLN